MIFALWITPPDVPVTTTLYVPGGAFTGGGGGGGGAEPPPQPATKAINADRAEPSRRFFLRLCPGKASRAPKALAKQALAARKPAWKSRTWYRLAVAVPGTNALMVSVPEMFPLTDAEDGFTAQPN